jgi:PAS domain S-box-containing protein
MTEGLERLKELAEKLNDAEYELARSNALLAAIVENTAEAILGKDLTGHINACNPAAEKLYGWPNGELIGKHVDILIPENHRSEHYAIMDRVATGESVRMHRTTRLKKNGTPLDLILTISPIRGLGGKILGASSLAHPVSWL